MKMNRLILMVFALLAFPAATLLAQETNTPVARPPMQAAKGPGGNDYAYTYSESRLIGNGASGALVFMPKGVMSEQGKLPVVVFLHGWGIVNSSPYGAWIDHIVRRRTIVIFPFYQDSLATPPALMTDNALLAVQTVFANLNKSGPFPDTDHVAYVGHGMGGVIAVNLAALARDSNLPEPRAVLSVAPGKTDSQDRAKMIPLANMSSLPPNMLLVTMAGSEDSEIGDRDARRIIGDSNVIKPDRKMMVVVRSDSHGSPALSADYLAPAGPDARLDSSQAREINDDSTVKGNSEEAKRLRDQIIARQMATQREAIMQQQTAGFGRNAESRRAARAAQAELKAPDFSDATVNALDWYGYWKTLDLVMDAAFSGKTIVDLAADPALTDMGRWSDGTPVKPLKIIRAIAE